MPDTYLSPPQLARHLGVGESKVLHWIKSGALAAVNVATGTLGRPRYRVSPQAVEQFLAGRQVAVEDAAPRRKRRPAKMTGWIERY